MKDRTLENMTRMTIDGQRYRVGNPNHPYHDLYRENGIEAVYDTMFKMPEDMPAQLGDQYETEIGLTFFAVIVATSLLVGGILAFAGVWS